eukprot:TRINITY_DN12477_c0_g1_i1.p1 TRINITY_DN12477_c0_g1~~TRINITY_DN12477_c0_g1_i1.p1  ORF type:complete len:218 (-),score=37.45 TRINITY_DN12477_c0_g1_i1:187-840(-)
MSLPLKIGFIGSIGVGKSSLIWQITKGIFPDEFDPTIEDTYRTTCEIKKETVTIELFDTLSFVEEHAVDQRPIYMRNSDAVVFVVDFTKKKQIEELQYLPWVFYKAFFEQASYPIPPVVVWANKSDMFGDYREQMKKEGHQALHTYVQATSRQLEEELGPVLQTSIDVSAKTRDGLDQAFQDIVIRAQAYKKQQLEQKSAAEKRLRKGQHPNRCVVN